MTRSIFLFAACAVLASGVVATQASAQQRVAVSTQGLDLATAAGARTFYSRLSHAVIAACGGAPTSFFASDEERFEACYKTTMDEAVAQAHAPLVAALRAGKPIRDTALASR